MFRLTDWAFLMQQFVNPVQGDRTPLHNVEEPADGLQGPD